MIRLLFAVFVLASCASQPAKPPVPEWTAAPARVVDNGYIVYVARGEAGRADDAQFKAEGQALEDLANECSVVPKGARVEDRFLETGDHGYVSFVRLAVEFTACDEAVRANDPAEIRRVANTTFTEQLKKYQDMQEMGFREEDTGEPLEVPTVAEAAPVQATGVSDHVHFYMTRQYVAYQKEIVVLAPPTTYAPGSKEAAMFHENVAPASERIAGLETKEPALRTAAYHEVPGKPVFARPSTLSRAAANAHARHEAIAPAKSPRKYESRPGQQKPRKQKRRRR